jgi:hypothetical protein
MPGAERSSDSTGIDFGRNNRFGDVSIGGTVAGRDVVQTSAVDPSDRQQLIDALAKLQAQVLQLEAAPAGEREDAHDELRKAREAAEQGDNDRMVTKLQGAQSILQKLGESLPAALALAQTVGTLVVKLAGLG